MNVKEKIKKIDKGSLKNARFNVILKRGAWFLASLVLSVSTVIGGSCPFAVSLICVSSRKNFLFSTVGAGLGYMIFCSGNDAIRYFSATIIACLGTLAINIFNTKKEAYLPMLVAFLSVFTTLNSTLSSYTFIALVIIFST